MGCGLLPGNAAAAAAARPGYGKLPGRLFRAVPHASRRVQSSWTGDGDVPHLLGLPLLQGLRALPASAQSLVGWRVVTQKRHGRYVPLGTVQQVEVTHPSGQGPTYQLLRVVRNSELQPYGFKGQEVHLLPLVPDILPRMCMQDRVLVTQPPEDTVPEPLVTNWHTRYVGFVNHGSCTVSASMNGSKQQGVKMSTKSNSGNKNHQGLLDLGRRNLVLSFLSQALLPYAAPAQGDSAAAGLVAAGARALTQVRQMPTRCELAAAGRQDLINLILKVGGFTQAALQLGLRASRRPAGYWDNLEVLDIELEAFIAGCWVALPCPEEEEEEEGADGANGPAHAAEVADRPPHVVRSQQHDQHQPAAAPDSSHSPQDVYYYNTATRSIRWSLPSPELFTAPAAAGDADSSSPGGSSATASGVSVGVGVGGVALSLPMYQALLELQGDRVMPPSSALIAAGRWDLHHAITRQGGYTAVAEELGRRHCRELPDELNTPQGLRTSLQDVARQEGWEVEIMPTAAQLRQLDRPDLIRAISQFGGWRDAAHTLGLNTHRPTSAAWRDWTITHLAQELIPFMDQQQQQQQQRPTQVTLTTHAGTAAAAGDGIVPATVPPSLPTPGTPGATSAATNRRLLQLVSKRLQQQQQQRQQCAAVGVSHLPTQSALLAAGRFDLVYSLRQHGYEAVRQHLGLQARYSTPKRKGVLEWSAVEAAVAAGCHSCKDILAYISHQQQQQNQQHTLQAQQNHQHATMATAPAAPSPSPQNTHHQNTHPHPPTTAPTRQEPGGANVPQQAAQQQKSSSAPAAAVPATSGAAGASAGAAGVLRPGAAAPPAVLPLVSREHLQRALKSWCEQGRLVKCGRSCFKLPAQCRE